MAGGTAIHPSCVGPANCVAAFVATRGYGLYYTESLTLDRVSDPTWEYVGYTNEGLPLGIKQFACQHRNPPACQVCLDFNNQAYVRTEKTGTWLKILDADRVRGILDSYGYTTESEDGSLHPVELGWIDRWPNQFVYCIVLCGGLGKPGSGQYFFKSDDNGTTWRVTAKLYGSSRWCSKAGAISIQAGSSVPIYPGQAIFATVYKFPFDRAGYVFSKDMGESWGPVNAKGVISPYWIDLLSSVQRPIASDVYVDACYGGIWNGLRKASHSCLRIGGWCTNRSRRDLDRDSTGWLINGAVTRPHGQTIYKGQGGAVWYTHFLEFYQSWTRTARLVNQNITALFYLMYAGGVDLFIGTANASSSRPHVVVGATDPFWDVYYKAGSNPNSPDRDSGSIYRRCGGVSRDGLVAWDVRAPVVPTPPPEAAIFGWPIWINAQAKELRADPGWDRLYVMSEAVWPGGGGLWNQPLMFQFVLSGYVGANYYENQGFLGFVPTFAQGQHTLYSGGINYAGVMEAHVNAPLVHGVVVVGKFAVNDQVRYIDDITLATGILLGQWDLVGAFGSHRVTSVDSEIAIKRDVLITYDDALSEPTDIVPTPWDWAALNTLPFVVNCQYRDTWLWVGAEEAGSGQPIRRTLLESGSAWQERGGGLPQVPITDIDGGY